MVKVIKCLFLLALLIYLNACFINDFILSESTTSNPSEFEKVPLHNNYVTQKPVQSSIPVQTVTATPVPTSTPITQTELRADKYSNVGEIVTFGTYEQDGDTGNGQEPIEWIIVSVKNNKSYLLSKYVLEIHEFDSQNKKSVSYRDCSLRNWLIHDFYDTAFSSEDRIHMASTKLVVTEGYITEYTLEDYVAVPSWTEAKEMISDNDQHATTTQHVINQQVAAKKPHKDKFSYWLACDAFYSDASKHAIAAYVADFKRPDSFEHKSTTNSKMGVRPTIRIDLSSLPN